MTGAEPLTIRHDPARLLVTGSRHWTDVTVIRDALAAAWHDLGARRTTVLVHGACRTGADQIARELWVSRGLPEEPHPAEWGRYGNRAGPLRNEQMVALGADLCLAFLTATSRGTRGCVALAKAADIPVRPFGAPI